MCAGLRAGAPGAGAGGARVREASGRGRVTGPAALPRHVRARSGAAVLRLRERAVQRALPLAGAANLTPPPGPGRGSVRWASRAATRRPRLPPGGTGLTRLDQWLRRAGRAVPGLADGSVPLFSSLAAGTKRQGGTEGGEGGAERERGESAGEGRNHGGDAALCLFRAAMTRSKGLCFTPKLSRPVSHLRTAVKRKLTSNKPLPEGH